MAEENKQVELPPSIFSENRWAAMSEEERAQEAERILELARNFKPFEQSDDYRDPAASDYGGFELRDDAQISKLRSVVSEIISVSRRAERVATADRAVCADDGPQDPQRRVQPHKN